ncbi:MAG TPA: hypothetical protein VKV32_04555 [Stellaceae bacterium]|nr:hypothetical protein [Stellaceae bacterium]
MNKEVEDLRLNSHEVRSPLQLAAIRIERTVLEQIAQDLTVTAHVAPGTTVAQATQRKNR